MSRELAGKFRESLKSRGLFGTVWHSMRYLYWLAEEATPKRRRHIAIQQEFDRKFGIQTNDLVALEKLDIPEQEREGVAVDSLGNAYQATPAWRLNHVLADLALPYENFVFVDLGSGKGRAVFMAAEFPFRKVIGVEISPVLHRMALENLRNYRSDTQRCRDVQLLCMNATLMPIPSEPAIFYMYNPFNEEAMKLVLENIRRSLERQPRDIVVIYTNPRLSRVLKTSSFLARVTTLGNMAVYRSVRRDC
jgi:SAM-dependent methyltransferase